MRHGSGAVRVSLTPVGDEEATGLRLRVEDEGEGISPELRRRVFTKFWKGGVTGGSGLGLYLVNGLVKAHGGTIAIGEADGGGARIDVFLPAVSD